ncbi:mannitol dehydrogenase family protein [Phenylobacterium sp.]|uniref:mannitol dehydrogenase family protein n=1 Tax=Phenylobacterium sp. TaxID=1871053 RepID=UPI0025D3456A|nr:mannitol dehydrogenase family protein [Phenylobacterium sp.]MCA3549147.1 mannitol dehydrogenase family protein [Rhodobacter sp.]MCA6263717.1 mannitol dehydrogenase family protein [Phenylobacterium sp.]MCA6280340.1 mannitol dehydrogenase family protein [Phenylobacterium sp.]MCA6317257.1 mannitol dehydrogenase family protein [Phenylobacterium sp.]
MPRILHFGLGAFHRAHQAAFTQDAGGWQIESVSMRNPALSNALNAAGGRWHLVERAAEGPRVRQMTVIDRAHCLATDPAGTLARMADPEVQVVTATVTEKGYGFHPTTRTIDVDHPSITPDLANPTAPKGLVGALVEGLRLRHAAGHSGLTVISCDNLTGNGHLLAGLAGAFARLRDPALADWIARTCTFPDSMVDRITPASSDATFAAVRDATGQDDPLAVETEPFRQWVIGNRFAGPRPAWEKAGALLVDDVAPYEVMKLRMLNGSHSLIACLGAVAGLGAVRDVMAVPAFRTLVRRHMQAAADTLPTIPGFDPATYAADLLRRFENPSIRHLCLQIAKDGSQKLPPRIFAPAAEAILQGKTADAFALVTAVWIRFLQGRDDTGGPIAPDDPLAQALMLAASSDVAAVAQALGLSDRLPFSSGDWRGQVSGHLASLRRMGAMAFAEALT